MSGPARGIASADDERVNLVHALEACERQAGFRYGWDDFAPVGLLIYWDGKVEAVAGYPAETTAAQACAALLRAARPVKERLGALGMVCSAWASRQAVVDAADPQTAADRARARLAGAADREWLFHLYSHIHEQGSSYDTEAAPVAGIGNLLVNTLWQLLEPPVDPHAKRGGRISTAP